MARKQANMSRITMNIPTEMLEKVEDIGALKGLNRTQTIIMALSQFIDQKESLDYLPRIIEYIKKEQENELKKLSKK